MKIYDKVTVMISKSMMNAKLIEKQLTVCRIDKDDSGNEFYCGWDENGKTRYFRTENIIA